MATLWLATLSSKGPVHTSGSKRSVNPASQLRTESELMVPSHWEWYGMKWLVAGKDMRGRIVIAENAKRGAVIAETATPRLD